ncbi:MAG: SpoIIE family protein phosphatase [Anaerolineae bacterium]|nr:SpoIIE family protein phosphatase [Anaerolineae bacterium]
MPAHSDLIKRLTMLNEIAETLNAAHDIRSALNEALARLVDLMDLETGWIFLLDDSAKNRWFGRGYDLVAHCNLPPALALDRARAWKGGCTCQNLCDRHAMDRAYNEVRCARLARAGGDRHGLAVHASTPLRSRNRTLGILNVAAPDWDSFSPEALAVLTNAGSQMGIALERARLFDMLQEQRIHEQAALLDFSNQLLSRPHLEDLVGYLVDEVRTLLQADACAMLLPSDSPDQLAFCAANGWHHDPVAAHRLVPLNKSSGPGLAMRNQRVVLIADLAQDNLTLWSPDWRRAESFRGHAVMPLIAEGRAIGALVIDMRTPRLLNEDETRLLQLMANQAAIAIENARLHKESIRRQRMADELAVGQQIQRSMLPQATTLGIPGWSFSSSYAPARMVGGDFYDLFSLSREDDRLGMVVADVADKGIPAALFMALSRTVIRATALSGRSPASTLMRANHLILNDIESDLFLSAFYAKLDTRTGRMVYANAGHNPPFWYKAVEDEFEALNTNGIVLGVLDDVELEERRIDVAPGDAVVFYTDGVTDAMNTAEKEFGEARLQAVVRAAAADRDAAAQQILRAVLDAVHHHMDGAPQFDDITLLVARRMSGPDRYEEAT